MPRSNRPRRQLPASSTAAGRNARRKWAAPVPEIDLDRARSGIPERESASDGEWSVRRITARNAAKDYRCPGCGQVSPPGIEHLVVCQEDSLFGRQKGVEDRRHWHDRFCQTRQGASRRR